MNTMEQNRLQQILTRLTEIDLSLAVLDRIIKAAQAAGDERWKEAVAPQADELNKERDLLIKEGRQVQGKSQFPASTITARVGMAQAKGK